MTYWLGVVCMALGLVGIGIPILIVLLSNAETKPTGAKTVLYKNDLDIALEMKVNQWWVDVRDATTLDALQDNTRFRVRKGDDVVYIHDVSQTEFIETTGLGDTFWLNHVEPEYIEFVNIRINKVTLVEMEKTESLRFGRFEKVITRATTNKMVVEYEVVNVDEYIRRIRLRKDNTELLQQFITPTKGE